MVTTFGNCVILGNILNGELMVRLATPEIIDYYSKRKIKLLSMHRPPLTAIHNLECDLCKHTWEARYVPDENVKCPSCSGKKSTKRSGKKGLFKGESSDPE